MNCFGLKKGVDNEGIVLSKKKMCSLQIRPPQRQTVCYLR
jgi:hypothetical protein